MILRGDCLDRLKELETSSIDLIASDPPYQLNSTSANDVTKGFMGKEWDVLPPVEVWEECLRVLKPGAFAFIMTTTRQDSLRQLLNDLTSAGFVMGFTSMYWAYLNGFPKASAMDKVVDKRLGATREAVTTEKTDVSLFGEEVILKTAMKDAGLHGGSGDSVGRFTSRPENAPVGNAVVITKPATEEAQALDGAYAGYQPKPAVEVIVVVMKPLSEKSYVDQAMKDGKGVTWIKDCRIPTDDPIPTGHCTPSGSGVYGWNKTEGKGAKGEEILDSRFPCNLLVTEDALGNNSKYISLDAWWGDKLKELPPVIQESFPFMFVPKPSKGEKEIGVEHFDEQKKWEAGGTGTGIVARENVKAKNFHPTVKPIKLMSYLITLGSRKGDKVLDPFVGSGTTVVAAELNGRIGIGIEREDEYADIAEARVEAAKRELRLF